MRSLNLASSLTLVTSLLVLSRKATFVILRSSDVSKTKKLLDTLGKSRKRNVKVSLPSVLRSLATFKVTVALPLLTAATPVPTTLLTMSVGSIPSKNHSSLVAFGILVVVKVKTMLSPSFKVSLSAVITTLASSTIVPSLLYQI